MLLALCHSVSAAPHERIKRSEATAPAGEDRRPELEHASTITAVDQRLISVLPPG
jgi:hypothetical protein